MLLLLIGNGIELLLAQFVSDWLSSKSLQNGKLWSMPEMVDAESQFCYEAEISDFIVFFQVGYLLSVFSEQPSTIAEGHSHGRD